MFKCSNWNVRMTVQGLRVVLIDIIHPIQPGQHPLQGHRCLQSMNDG